jgi:hypothetical protein
MALPFLPQLISTALRVRRRPGTLLGSCALRETAVLPRAAVPAQCGAHPLPRANRCTTAARPQIVLEPVTLPLLNKPLVPGVGLLLPNALSFPIMPKFGLPDPPIGAIKVRR